MIAVGLALTALFAVPLLGGKGLGSVVVVGHSMEPTMHTGDLVLAWPAGTYRVGDITPYRVPKGQPGEGHLVIHRIVGGDAVHGFVMKGDNNPAPDIWTPRPADLIGRKFLLVPRLGWLLAFLRQPLVLAAMAGGIVTARMITDGGTSGPGTGEPEDGHAVASIGAVSR